MSRLRRLAVVPLALLACVLVACIAPVEPVASVSVEPTSLTLHYSEVQEIELTFSMLQPLEEGDAPRVFVHLYEEPVEVLRTFDHPFPGEWIQGGLIRHRLRVHQSALGPPLRAGRYYLSVGLYDIDGRRWPLDVEGDEIDEMEYQVAEVVVAEDGALPMFRFSEGWAPVEPGRGRQILGRRWLGGEGTIGVTEVGTVGSIWMLLQIPAPIEGESRLILEENAEEPGVLLTSSCGGRPIELVGTGAHEVILPLHGALVGETGECEITFRPNFHLLVNGHGQRRAVLLEALGWGSAGNGPAND